MGDKTGGNGNGSGPAPSGHPTLIRPPPEDPNKAPIENVLDVTELSVLGPDIFTNTRQPWHPPGARGIFGGAVIAMCLAAGQRTVKPGFVVHSCHCYFLLAGSGDTPILFHVERVRDGRSFATRTVQARQRGRCIFTTTISFVLSSSASPPREVVRHAAPIPADALPPPDAAWAAEPELVREGPFQTYRISVTNQKTPEVHTRKTRQWIRARGKISKAGGLQAHLNALAYMSDSYFIGTISRIHNLWRYPIPVEDVDKLHPELVRHIKTLHEFEGGGDLSSYIGRPQVGMMVSLDHTIYFHEPERVRADEWMFTEMESPWSGDGRGVVTQRIFSKDGTLLATCFQEGIVRLKEKEESDDQSVKPKL